ncbi:MAG: PAS domain-containing sensor histidine kinase [Prolixibacteraceae bacterium]|nr:PAS domain-containing sensor histidine kinase [Prolixibacteraceae bacterium]
MKQQDIPQGFVESLFSNKGLYLVLFENATNPILFIDGIVVIDCNESARNLLGIGQKEKITGNNFAEFCPEKQPDGSKSVVLFQELVLSLNTGEQKKINWQLQTAKGQQIAAEITINSFSHENKQLYQLTFHSSEPFRQAEISQTQSENKYQRIFENVQDVFYRTDINGILTEISPSIKRYSKYIHSDIIGKPIEKFYVNPADREKLIREISEKGEALDFEILLKGLDNQQVWSSVNAHFTYDENGKVNGVEGTIRDLTERKQTEEKLKQSLSMLQATLDSTDDGILVTNLQGKITGYNKRFKEMFHHKEETLQSGEDAAIINAVLDQMRDPNQFVSKIQFLYDNTDIESFDILDLIDGRIVERFSRPQILEGKSIGRVWNFRDVTQKKKSEQQIHLMAHTLKSINESISITDTANTILFVNDAFIKTYGYTSEDELIGENIAIVRSHKNDPEIISKIINSTANSGWQGEIMNQRKDGTEFPISLSSTVVQNENGEVLGMVGVAVDITERKLEELALKESEERYRTLFEGSPDAIFLAEAETGIIIDANPAASVLMKMPIEKIIGMHQSQLHPSDRKNYSQQTFKDDSEKQSANGDKKSHENLVVCSDGNCVPVEIMANTIHIKGKQVLQGVFRNISDRKQAEKALKDKEAHLSTLVQTIPDLIWVKDINGVYITCNKMFEKFFGAEAIEIIGKTDYDFVSKELADFFRMNDRIAINAGAPTRNEEWITFASDGHQALLETIKSPMFDSTGAIIGVLGIGHDITHRHKAAEQLKQSELKYRTLIESMPDGVYRTTPDGKFVEANPAMVKILGYNDQEDLMKIDIKTQLYFNPEDRESVDLTENPDDLDVYPLRKKDGSVVWVEDHGWYVKDEAGDILFHEGVLRDVTERKMSEMQLLKFSEELQELNATKDKFFSIIAHDLKSPFNSVIGLSEIIKNEAKHLDIATIEQYAGMIYTTSTNTFRLLENLLEWARIQRSQIIIRPVSVILKNVVADVIEIMVDKANSKMIAIINYIPDNLIAIADEDMLKTVLRNLISNALKFTPVNGKVEISASMERTEVEISVKDNGIGIQPEEMEKIFKIGSNISKRGTQNEKGTGLGLILCKEFIEKMGGKIWVESTVGIGSRFIFTLRQSGQN